MEEAGVIGSMDAIGSGAGMMGSGLGAVIGMSCFTPNPTSYIGYLELDYSFTMRCTVTSCSLPLVKAHISRLFWTNPHFIKQKLEKFKQMRIV